MQLESNKTDLSWKDIETRINSMIGHIKFYGPTHIVGITRGGLVPAVMLSHALDLPMETLGVSFRDNKATHHTKFEPINDAKYLIVDDINDSGTTFWAVAKVFKNRRLNFRTVALQSKESSNFTVDFYGEMQDNDNWINFPWENINNDI